MICPQFYKKKKEKTRKKRTIYFADATIYFVKTIYFKC